MSGIFTVPPDAGVTPPLYRRHAFPWPSLTLLALFTLVAFAAAIGGFAYLTRTGAHAADQAQQASSLGGEIGRLDEVLTMSANMAAQSGDLKWVTRYERNVPLLDADIKKAMNLAPDEAARQFSATTQAANNRLVEYETKALDLVRSGALPPARAILSSTAYARDKLRYAQGLKALMEVTGRELQTRRNDLNHLHAQLIWGLMAIGVLIGLSWLRLLLVLRRWRTGLITSEEARRKAADMEADREAEALRDAQARADKEAEISREAAEAHRKVDLQAEAEERRLAARNIQRQELLTIAEHFEGSAGQVAEKLSRAVDDLQAMAASLAAAAERTSSQAVAVASASGQTATSVKSISKAGEEVSASTLEISQQAAVSAKISARAVQEMAQSERCMDLLTENTEQIGRVTELIASIAGRTKLLAINATIEASRAAEGGRGFIVVANEIKALASQTANATQQIAQQIASVRDATGGSALALRASSLTLSNIDQAATAIAAATHQQSYAVAEVARHVQSAADGTEHVSHSIVEVSAAAEEAGRAAKDLLRSATDLAGDATFLRQQVGDFLKTVRAI
jgi:methyl-accepting chemotaxis protein